MKTIRCIYSREFLENKYGLAISILSKNLMRDLEDLQRIGVLDERVVKDIISIFEMNAKKLPR